MSFAPIDRSGYWEAVAAEAARLPTADVYHLTSLQNRRDPLWRAGIVCEVATPRLTAQRIVEGSHRLATAAEIEAYLAAKRQREQDLKLVEDRRRSTSILTLAPDAKLRALGET